MWYYPFTEALRLVYVVAMWQEGGLGTGFDAFNFLGTATGTTVLVFFLWATQIKDPPMWVRWSEYKRVVDKTEKLDAQLEDLNATAREAVGLVSKSRAPRRPPAKKEEGSNGR